MSTRKVVVTGGELEVFAIGGNVEMIATREADAGFGAIGVP